MKLLILEQRINNRTGFLSEKLCEFNFKKIYQAKNEEQMRRNSNLNYDLLIFDYTNPISNQDSYIRGLETIKLIREDDVKTPIYFCIEQITSKETKPWGVTKTFNNQIRMLESIIKKYGKHA